MITNTEAFGGVLSKIRKERGFISAHQFFKSVGGSKSLGLSFMSYWNAEHGRKVPKSGHLKAIMAALRIGQRSPEARELTRAYFSALPGFDELLQNLPVPAPAGAALPVEDPEETATHKAIALRNVNLTLKQWKLRTRDIVTHICQNFLANTAGWVTVRELSEATRFKPEDVRKALKALASARLVDFANDRARGPLSAKMIQPLPTTPATAAIQAALRSNWDTWLADSKRVVLKRLTFRMTKANLDLYRQKLEKAVNLVAIYESAEADRQDSAIYLVDAGIFQILPKT